MVDHPPSGREPGETRPPPGAGRLDRPPSERYRRELVPGPPTGVARAVARALGVGMLGAIAIAGLGEVLAIGAGLVAVAALIGWLVAADLRTAAGLPRRSRQALAIVIAVGAVGLGQIGLWLVSLTEGTVVDPLTYLGAVFGFLIPAELAAAAVVAWWTAR